jgi:hypothetical protein
MLHINERTPVGNLFVSLPDPEQITNAKVREAAEKTRDIHAKLRDARRAQNAADNAVIAAENAVEVQAAEAMIKSGKMPKGLRRAVREAEEALVDSQDLTLAYQAAFADSYRTLVAVIEANAEKWRADLLKDAERSVNLLAAARRSAVNADREATAAFGLLGMLAAAETNGAVRPVIGEAPHTVFVGMALEPLGEAIGKTALRLEAYRRG